MSRFWRIPGYGWVFMALSLLAGVVLCSLQAGLEMTMPMRLVWLDPSNGYPPTQQDVMRLEKGLLSETLAATFVSTEVDYYLHHSMIEVDVKRAVGWPIAWMWFEHHREVVLLMSRDGEVRSRTETEMTPGSKRFAGMSGLRFLVFMGFWVGCGLVTAGIIPIQRWLRGAIRTRRGLCAYCGYRRRGWVGAVCPECGETSWSVGESQTESRDPASL